MSKKSTAVSSEEDQVLKAEFPEHPGDDAPAAAGTTTSNPIQASAVAQSTSHDLHQFEFVSSTDDASRRRARAHVMRDFMRKRRQQEIDNYRSGRSRPSSIGSTDLSSLARGDPKAFWTGRQEASVGASGGASADLSFANVPSSASGRLIARKSHQYSTSAGSSTPDAESSPFSEEEDVLWDTKIERGYTSDITRFSDPLNSLSTTPGDPFSSLSLPLNPDSPEQVIVHHCINTLPRALFQRVSVSCNPHGSLIHLWGQYEDPLGFQAMLCYGATQLSALQGQPNAPLALTLKARLIRRINDGLGSATAPTSPILLFAIMCLTVIESRSGTKLATAIHYNALLALLRNIGGLRGLPAVATPILCKHIFSSLMTTETTQQYIGATDWGLSWDGLEFSRVPESYFRLELASDLPPWRANAVSPTIGLSKTEAAREACQQLLRFLRACWTLALSTRQTQTVHLRPPSKSLGIDYEAPLVLRLSLFRPGSTLFNLLYSQPWLQAQSFGTSKTRSHVPVYSQLAVLIYFNVTVWNYRQDSDKLYAWLTWIQMEITADYENKAPTVHGFLPTLIYQEKNSLQQDVERSWTWWFTSRLLRTCKRLGEMSWKDVRILLLSCLNLEIEEYFNLNEDLLKQEILGQLYLQSSGE